MKDRLQKRYGVRFVDLRLAGNAPAVAALVVRDRRDKRVLLRDGIAISQTWPRAELLVTQGLGHSPHPEEPRRHPGERSSTWPPGPEITPESPVS